MSFPAECKLNPRLDCEIDIPKKLFRSQREILAKDGRGDHTRAVLCSGRSHGFHCSSAATGLFGLFASVHRQRKNGLCASITCEFCSTAAARSLVSQTNPSLLGMLSSPRGM